MKFRFRNNVRNDKGLDGGLRWADPSADGWAGSGVDGLDSAISRRETQNGSALEGGWRWADLSAGG